jgi:rare lipoprotein A
LLLLPQSVHASGHDASAGNLPVAAPSCRRVSGHASPGTGAAGGKRIAFAILLVFTAVLTVACGSKRPVTRTIPPPPTIQPEEKPETAKTGPEKSPTPATKEKESDEDEFAEYRNAKPVWSEVGYASWYGPPYHNRRGANGQVYDQNAMTAAHKTLPMGSIVRVTNLKTGSQTMLRVTDRGPFVGDRIIDLSVAAAKAVDVWRPGTAKVRIDVLHAPADIASGGRWCVQVGAFSDEDAALRLKSNLQQRYQTAKVLEFAGPTGYWVRIRVQDDDKSRAEEAADAIAVDEGGVFLVRLD